MKLLTLMPLLLHASCAALPGVLVVATGSTVQAQVNAGEGLVMAVDVGKNTMVLETRSGLKQVLVAATAAIRGDHGEVLALGDLKPGDAVAYRTGSDTATSLHVASHFWAVPSD